MRVFFWEGSFHHLTPSPPKYLHPDNLSSILQTFPLCCPLFSFINPVLLQKTDYHLLVGDWFLSDSTQEMEPQLRASIHDKLFSFGWNTAAQKQLLYNWKHPRDGLGSNFSLLFAVFQVRWMSGPKSVDWQFWSEYTHVVHTQGLGKCILKELRS